MVLETSLTVLAVVEVDDIDSALGECGNESTNSILIASIAVKYDWRHGRRYHGYQSGKYSFPNDDTEQDRLNLIYYVFFRLLEDRLFLAPIRPEGLRILDLGTGTGTWVIEIADLFPSVEVVGNDLSPI